VEGGSKRGHPRRETSGGSADELSQRNKQLLVGPDRGLGGQVRDSRRRRDLWRAEEGQDRMACSKVCGASEHNRQDVSASGLSHEG